MTELKNDGLLVFGGGQMRTGTTSLKIALEYLYQGKCYHMSEVYRNDTHIKLWQKVIQTKSLSKEDADELFDGYCCALDLPMVAFYRDMIRLYPNAKVILTTRDPDSWVKSVRETTLERELPSFLRKIFYYITGLDRFWKMIYILYPMCFNRSLLELLDDNVLRQCFIDHNEGVKAAVPKEQLLVFESRQGWAPLCEFLGKPVPNIPYPRVNSTSEFQKSENLNNLSFLCKAILKVAIPTAMIGVAYWYLKIK